MGWQGEEVGGGEGEGWKGKDEQGEGGVREQRDGRVDFYPSAVIIWKNRGGKRGRSFELSHINSQ